MFMCVHALHVHTHVHYTNVDLGDELDARLPPSVSTTTPEQTATAQEPV